MFKTLKFNFTILAGIKAGRTFSGDYNFETGMTGFFGDNEAGKSLRFEMLRFALFGSKALRGSSDDYKKLDVECVFQIKDAIFKVTRTIRGANLSEIRNDKEFDIASGTKPVNEAILRKLGYGMDVFDIANASLQGETEALTNMKPTARKQMVDNILGLNCLDKLSAIYAEKAKVVKAGIDGISSMIREPVQPVAPEQFCLPASGLLEGLKKLEADNDRYQALIAELAALHTQEPKAPEQPALTRTTAELLELRGLHNAAEKKVKALAKQILDLSKTATEPTPEIEARIALLQEYLDQKMPLLWKHYHQFQRELAELPVLDLSLSQAEAHKALKTFDRIEAFEKAEKLRCSSEISCPHCTGKFSLQQEAIDKILDPVRSIEEVDVAGLTRAQVERHLINIDRIRIFEEKWGKIDHVEAQAPHMDYIDTPDYLLVQELGNLKRMTANYTSLKDLVEQEKAASEELRQINFDATELHRAQEYDTQIAAYEKELSAYQKYVTRRVEVEPELKELENVKETLEAQKILYHTSLVYEQQFEAWQEQVKVYDQSVARVKAMTEELDKLNLIRKGLIDLKPKIKSYLMPSLNIVASNFLTQMTSGVRNSIYIDNEFDILVDGQRVETLSGSGKAVVNLAIRIALGTVLTNKIFSVFMVDEADAAMRGERASYTAECLRNLRKTVSQIFIISHKDIEVDTRILV